MMARGCKPETCPQQSNYSSYREGVGHAQVPRHSSENHKSLPDQQQTWKAKERTSEHAEQSRKSCVKPQGKWALLWMLAKNGNISPPCHFHSSLCLQQHILKLKVTLLCCGQSEQVFKSTMLCVVSLKHYWQVRTVRHHGACHRALKV